MNNKKKQRRQLDVNDLLSTKIYTSESFMQTVSELNDERKHDKNVSFSHYQFIFHCDHLFFNSSVDRGKWLWSDRILIEFSSES